MKFLSVDEILAIHAATIDHFGGQPGVRDLGLVESAAFRPRSGYYETIFDCAAALMESLLMNHAFVDGNKRVAFFCTDVFLTLNGYRLTVTQKPTDKFIRKIIADDDRFAKLVGWLASNSEPI